MQARHKIPTNYVAWQLSTWHTSVYKSPHCKKGTRSKMILGDFNG
ncbi:hypothetical protein ABIE16_000931 [Pseudomonas sp. 2725]|jgi:hypothetical protein